MLCGSNLTRTPIRACGSVRYWETAAPPERRASADGRTAKTLGLDISTSMLARADGVIE